MSTGTLARSCSATRLSDADVSCIAAAVVSWSPLSPGAAVLPTTSCEPAAVACAVPAKGSGVTAPRSEAESGNGAEESWRKAGCCSWSSCRGVSLDPACGIPNWSSSPGTAGRSTPGIDGMPILGRPMDGIDDGGSAAPPPPGLLPKEVGSSRSSPCREGWSIGGNEAGSPEPIPGIEGLPGPIPGREGWLASTAGIEGIEGISTPGSPGPMPA
eukprot:3321315-Rhodomonas_salina.2